MLMWCTWQRNKRESDLDKMTIKVCPRCHQAFVAKYDFVKYCEECLPADQWREVAGYVGDDE